jgi:hypothetical protein
VHPDPDTTDTTGDPPPPGPLAVWITAASCAAGGFLLYVTGMLLGIALLLIPGPEQVGLSHIPAALGWAGWALMIGSVAQGTVLAFRADQRAGRP